MLLGRLLRLLFPPLRPPVEWRRVTAEVTCPYCRQVVRPAFDWPDRPPEPTAVMAGCPGCERVMALDIGTGA